MLECTLQSYGGTEDMSKQDMRFVDWRRPLFVHGELTQWHWVVYYPERFELGYETDIGVFTAIFCQNGVTVEDHVQIGGHCLIYSESTISLSGESITGKVVIKKGSMIGAHSTVMPGVTIGERAVVGAHSLVTDDVPAGEVWGGVPARFLNKRRGR